MLEALNVSFKYSENESDSGAVFSNFSLSVAPGQFVALLGSNGSGKSTLGRLFNGLLLPNEGTIKVDGLETTDADNIWEVRKRVGLVFQDPGRQLVAAVVEDDIAFGLENLGIPRREIQERIDNILIKLNIESLRKAEPHYLSGGQKQRVALAGVLAMEPSYLVLDEPTAMLDPQGRRSVVQTVKMLQQQNNLGIVYITHHMDEALCADRVVVLDKGNVVEDTMEPYELFGNISALDSLGLQVPALYSMADELRRNYNIPIELKKISPAYIADKISTQAQSRDDAEVDIPRPEINTAPAIELSKVSYTYLPGTPFAHTACADISLRIYSGECLGIIGATGSGKSTLLQLFNGLIRSDTGTVTSFGKVIPRRGNSKDLAEIREKIGFLFQFSEQQLFETTVYDDVAFGPRNMGLDKDEVDRRVRHALDMVSIPESMFQRSPLSLSGGEKRRIALAGVLSCEPQCLVLDEPTVGLDPQATKELLNLLRSLNREKGLTVVLISHRYEEVAIIATRLAIMAAGHLLAVDSVPRLLYDRQLLQRAGLEGSDISEVFSILHEKAIGRDFWPVQLTDALDAIGEIVKKI